MKYISKSCNNFSFFFHLLVILYGLLNPPVITVIEGESVTVLPGFIGDTPTVVRSFQLGELYTESGSAIGKTIFMHAFSMHILRT